MTMEAFYRIIDGQFTRGEREQMEGFLLKCSKEENEELRLAALNELGSFYRGAGQYSRSLTAFEAAEALAARTLGTECTQYATILNNMAGTCRLAQHFQQAIALFERALEIHLAIGERESYAFASVLNNLALVYRETGQREEAAACLEQALTLISRMPDKRAGGRDYMQ